MASDSAAPSSDERIADIANENGFSLIDSHAVAEIDGKAHVMHHDASGARLMWLQNADANRSFSITFKTPAADDTGVFHILEHSVLCGSEKFPVKEPFVNLLKSSMQTFLNAMTFPDKTMYPVASTNEKDLMNLMDVYLDAVFHPNIYKKRTIFQQEGWHLEFKDDAAEAAEDGASSKATVAADAPSTPELVYNGVVFNEMKGALSDPDSVLFDTLSAALFPDTTYRFESGGTPESIPTLTYGAFLDNHRRHYRPDNAYIILYGALDLERFLRFISEGYLTPIATAPGYRRPQVHEAGTAGIRMEPNPLDLQEPVRAKGIVKEMVTTPDNSCAALGYVIAEAKERECIIAVDILMDAIMGSNESPLKRALIEADIANDCSSQVVDSLAQPFVMIQAKGLKTDAVAKLERTVREELGRLADGGLDRTLVRAALSHAEFIMREQNFGYPDGVILSMSAMSGWLYDEEMPLGYILYEDAFASLRKRLDEGYFEQLIREVFLESDHEAQVEVVPVDADPNAVLEKRLSALADSMDADAFEGVATELEALRAAQSAADSPEDLAKLPRLEIADIGDAPHEPPCKTVVVEGAPMLSHEVPTHGIAYFYRYYPMADLAFEDLPYVTILAMVLGKLDTEHHTAIELDTLVQEKLGSLSFQAQIFDTGSGIAASSSDPAPSADRIRPQFVVGAAALKHNASDAATLAREIIKTSKLDDPKRILDILVQRRTMMEQKFATAGNSFAISRAASYYSEASVIREQLDGIDFYTFLKALTDDFEHRRTGLIEKLTSLSEALFAAPPMLSWAGDDEAIRAYRSAWSDGLMAPAEALAIGCAMEVPAPVNRHEAFIAPCDITFTATSFDRSFVGGPLTGPWLVASRALTYDYLWNEVRVVGGAYGVGFTSTRQGPSYFYSYRDPHIDETIGRFDASPAWLCHFDPSPDELTGFIVSTASTFDAPLKPRALIRRQDQMFMSDYTPEERLGLRSSVIATKLDDVRAIAVPLQKLCAEQCVCCVGNRQIIEGSDEGFDVIDLFAQG